MNFVVLNDDLVISDKFKKLLLIIFYLTFANLRIIINKIKDEFKFKILNITILNLK